ncbi:MAG: hypothetical protein Q9213_006646 [Squamulea squamosa]
MPEATVFDATDTIYESYTISSAAEVSFLQKRFGLRSRWPNNGPKTPSPLIAEVGTGSGVVLAFITAHAQTLFGRSDILSLGIDINHYACRASIQTVEKACQDITDSLQAVSGSMDTGLLLTSIDGNLTSAIRSGVVDVLVFNPPYVPTCNAPAATAADGANEDRQTDLDADSDLLSLSYAGGVDGMEVTNRLLDQLPSVLDAHRGVAYLLLCKQNKPDMVAQRIRQWGYQWTVDVVGRSGKQGGWEKLQILRIFRGT